MISLEQLLNAALWFPRDEFAVEHPGIIGFGVLLLFVASSCKLLSERFKRFNPFSSVKRGFLQTFKWKDVPEISLFAYLIRINPAGFAGQCMRLD